MPDLAVLCDQIEALARDAGAVILDIYNSDFEVRSKDDTSPVTEADEAAEAVILAGLRQLTPDIPIVAEEAVAAGHVPDVSGGRFWLVDPLDGTKEFISRNGEFTVNIALIEDGVPVLGAVYAPAIDRQFSGHSAKAWSRVRERSGLWSPPNPIQVRPEPEEGLTVVASRSHRSPETDEYIARFKVNDLVSAGSSLKLCLVAAGEADLYPRLGRTMEWDIAAGHAVLRAAGGTVTDLDGNTLSYGKPEFENPYFVAKGSVSA